MVQITVDSKESDFEVYFKNPIPVMDGPYEISLTSCTLWYSWDNISPEFDNDRLKIFQNGKWEIINIPAGNYDGELLNFFLQDKYGANPPITFDVNAATNRFILAINKVGTQVDMKEGKLNELLGFEGKIYSEPVNFGEFPGNITRGVERVLIHCSIINDSYQNQLASDILYSFFPSVSPGSQIQCEAFHPKYLPLRPVDYVHNLHIRVTDQLNRPILFKGDTLTFVFDLRKSSRS